MLEARALSVNLGGAPVLRGATLAVARGEVCAVVGPNGAGKSTLARALAGLVTPREGTAAVNGAPAPALPRRELAKTLAYLPQDTPADLPFSALEVALMGRAPHLGPLGLEGDDDRARARAALARVHADTLADRPLHALSGGERRRVLLASVLVQDAPAWILDEPTAHLDLAHQALVLQLAREHAARGGAVLLVLHDLLHAAACDRVAILQAGAMVASGPPAQVLDLELLRTVFGVPFFTARDPASGAELKIPAPPPR